MRDLIVKALKASIEQYPDIIPLLSGNAALYAQILAYKAGEAPDDDERLANELILTGKVTGFFQSQLVRLIKALREQFGILPVDFWNNELFLMWTDLGPTYTRIIVNAAGGGINLLYASGVSQMVDMDNVNINLIRWIGRYRDEWLSRITETSRQYIADKIVDWLRSGDPLESLVKSLMEDQTHMFDEIRARRIATTEVTRLYAMGNQAAWEESGYIASFRWNTAEDELVCKICGRPDGYAGKEFPLSELSNMMPAHPNCRCWATPIVNVDMFEQEIERILDGGG